MMTECIRSLDGLPIPRCAVVVTLTLAGSINVRIDRGGMPTSNRDDFDAFWLSPSDAMQFVEELCAALRMVYPANSEMAKRLRAIMN